MISISYSILNIEFVFIKFYFHIKFSTEFELPHFNVFSIFFWTNTAELAKYGASITISLQVTVELANYGSNISIALQGNGQTKERINVLIYIF